MTKEYNRRMGEIYGDWTVVNLDESKLKENMCGVHLYYIIKCVCGTIKSTPSNELKKQTNCGCKPKQDLVGKSFGKIKIIAFGGFDNRYGRNKAQWLGVCSSCGKQKKYLQEILLRGDISGCGKCKPKGIESSRYNPSSDRYNRRDSTEYKQFVKQVFQRDKYKCIICGSTKKLNAHHLNAWHWYAQGRFDPNNAVTLCGHANGCHILFHKQFGKYQNTKYQFEQFFRYQKFIIDNMKKK